VPVVWRVRATVWTGLEDRQPAAEIFWDVF
jgi:hypothetical protein